MLVFRFVLIWVSVSVGLVVYISVVVFVIWGVVKLLLLMVL